MKRVALALLLGIMVVAVGSQSSQALPPFKKAFDAKYVKPSKNVDFQKAFKKASCNTCHVKGKKKNVHNAYGKELNKLIEGDAKDRIKAATKDGGDEGKAAETKKVLEELEQAFKKVEELEAPEIEGKFGARIKEGLLPVPLPVAAAK